MPQTHLQFFDRKSGLILRVPVGEAKGQWISEWWWFLEVAFFKQVVSYVPPKKWTDLNNDSQSVHGFCKGGLGDCRFRRWIGILWYFGSWSCANYEEIEDSGVIAIWGHVYQNSSSRISMTDQTNRLWPQKKRSLPSILGAVWVFRRPSKNPRKAIP